MNLSLRLNLLFAGALVLLLAAAGSIILAQARRSVADEIDSAVTLTMQLLEAISANVSANVAGPGPNTTPPNSAEVTAALISRLNRLQNVRHLDITLVRGDGLQPFTPSLPRGDTQQLRAPAWFANLVAPDPVEYRLQLAIPYQRIGIAVRPNPTDEIHEAWVESRSTFALLGSLALVVMALTWLTSRRALQPVGRVLRALERLEQGDRSARLEAFDLPELQQISEHFNRVAETLARQEAENRELSRRALDIQEAERRRLAHELHDELGQAVSAIKALAVSVRQRPSVDAAARENATTICEVCDHMYEAVRRLMSELRPAALDSLGLHASLRKLVEDWEQRHGDVVSTAELDPRLDQFDDTRAIKIYRIVQEALTNIARHARAQRVDICARLDDAAERLTLSVQDDGTGFDPDVVRYGLGLLGIRERVDADGGTLRIHTGPGLGTRLTIVLPVLRQLAQVSAGEALTPPGLTAGAAHPVVSDGPHPAVRQPMAGAAREKSTASP